jgi:DNA-binding SARP family transcriptional activator
MPDIEFRILGPLAVVRDDTEVDLGGRRRRAALALLLLEPGRPVPTDRFVDRLWGESPPAGAVEAIEIVEAPR